MGGFSCLDEFVREAIEHVFPGGAGTDTRRRETAKLGVDAGTRGPRGEGPGQHGPRDGWRQPRLKTRPQRHIGGAGGQRPKFGRSRRVDDQLLETPARVAGDQQCRRAVPAGSRQAVADGVLEGLAKCEYPGQRLDLAGLAACAEDPVAVGKFGQRAAEILQPLRGQGKTHPELAGLAHIALDLGAHGGRAGGPVELIVRKPFGRLANIAQARRVPDPVGRGDIAE